MGPVISYMPLVDRISDMNILDMLQQLQDGEPKQVAGNDLDFMMPDQKFQKPGMKNQDQLNEFHKNRGSEIGPPPIDLPPRWEDIPNDLPAAQEMLQRDQYASHARTAHNAPYDTQIASDQSQRYNNFVKRFGAENLPEQFLLDRTHENFGDPDDPQYTGRPGKPRYPSDKDYRMLDQLGDTNYGDPREAFAKRFGANRFDYEQRNAPPGRSKKAPQRRKPSDEEELGTIQDDMGRLPK